MWRHRLLGTANAKQRKPRHQERGFRGDSTKFLWDFWSGGDSSRIQAGVLKDYPKGSGTQIRRLQVSKTINITVFGP